jgi:hypothetical protein
VNARDFDTSNAIDARPGSKLRRFSLRPLQAHDVEMGETSGDDNHAHVLLTADVASGDGTVDDGLWGYVLKRGDDGLWHIVDAGVV